MASLFTAGKFQAMDGLIGLAAPGAQLFTYAAGTTTPQATFTNQGGGSANTNPVICDSSGKANVWLSALSYRMILKDFLGVTIWDEDNITGDSAASTALASDLANATDATKGAGLVGVGQALSYAAGTVGALLRNVGAPRAMASFGVLHNDGTTDDSAVFQAAAASGALAIDARGLNCKIAGTINIPSGQVWLLQGTSITISSSTLTVFNCATKSDFALMGVFTITGAGTPGACTIGTARGIYIKDCANYYIDRPVLRNIQGWGILLDADVSTTARSQHGVINNPRIDSCYYGWEDIAGTGAEYTVIIDPYVTRCTLFGVKTCAGNLEWLGGNVVDNLAIGVWLAAGANHGHGIFTGTQINHNGTFGIQATAVINGYTFNGCHIYQNDVWFDQSKGIQINGGHLDCKLYNYKGGSSGLNWIDGCYCPGAYGVARFVGANDGHDQLIITNLWGLGAYAFPGGKDTAGVTINDPSRCYVVAQRDAAATQSLVTGTPAVLTWSATPPMPDRRLMANFGTGTFTIPTGQAGWFHIDFDLLFGGTAMSTTASFVEVKVNGTSKKASFPSINSTTKLHIQDSIEPIYLNDADIVTIVATITGTTPTFGDGAWASNMTIRRIA